VATKSDLDLAQQRHEVQPDTYCRRLALPAPVAVSTRAGSVTNLWVAVTRMALNPYVTFYMYAFTWLINSHTGMIRGPSSTISPAQRIRLIAGVTLAATSVTAVIGVWMRYQGYTFKGIWGWFGRTSLFGSKA
jgi:Ras family protein T1